MPLYWPVKPITNPFGPQALARMAPYVPFRHNDGHAHLGSHVHHDGQMHHCGHAYHDSHMRHGSHAPLSNRMRRTPAATHKQETRLAHA